METEDVHRLNVFTTFLPGNGFSTNTKKVQKDARPLPVVHP